MLRKRRWEILVEVMQVDRKELERWNHALQMPGLVRWDPIDIPSVGSTGSQIVEARTRLGVAMEARTVLRLYELAYFNAVAYKVKSIRPLD